jgi:glutamate-1-semialdehyde 2,1-aminomutase
MNETSTPARRYDESKRLFDRANAVIPGGVNSPVRAFRAVGGDPLFIARGEGAHIYDADGNAYLDCIGSWGPLMLGHLHPRVVAALREQLGRGMTYGAPTELEVRLAELVCEAVPSVEKLRLVSSGTEATMSAIRVARGYTGRQKIVKFEGCYHGHADFLLAKAGSGVATLGLPDCAGVPYTLTADTITLPFNDFAALKRVFSSDDYEVACAIVEPVVGNMGCVPPAPGFLQALRDVTTKSGAVLIFDEVMTGFRLAYGGAQERYRIRPDLSTFGKVIGGGLPVGAYGGREEIMRKIAPDGPVYQAGTLSGNPLAVAAGLAALEALGKPGTYEKLESTSAELEQGLARAIADAGVPARVNRVGSMWTLFFTQSEVFDYPSAKKADVARFGKFFHAMLDRGVYLPPSQFESAFVSLAHGPEEIAATVAAAAEALKEVS